MGTRETAFDMGASVGADEIVDDGAVVVAPWNGSKAPALPARACGAVVIPAHNEETVIARTLTALRPLVAVESIEVIVVCNGCQDATAEIARGFRGVIVIETGEGSKTRAMNIGDDAATTWPRLYLDADIEVDPRAVLAVFHALSEPGVLAARARYVYDVTGATWPVRAYYRARSRIPAPSRRLWGAGGYATSRDGHERFGRFAAVTADDSWFDEQFATAEKRVVPTVPMRVRTPRDTAGLLAVLTRQRRGYVEIEIASHGSTRTKELLRSVRGPAAAADAAWYILLTLRARRRAQSSLRRRAQQWERDSSSRTGISPSRTSRDRASRLGEER